ncbi:MAG: AAA family ATPase, partial [Acidobacteria bacterium]|nr:AAA family ATPase [Acidobacteriota bacterium]
VSRESPFIGRYQELQTLRTLFRDAQQGDGRVVLLEGETGVGKSRLVDELARRLFDAHEPLQLLYGSNAPGLLGDASGALSRAVLDYFGTSDLERRLSRYLMATPRLVPGFVSLLTGRALPEGAMPLTSDAVQAVFCYLASVLAVDQPLLWVVEDLHFATAETLGLFATLARQAPEMSLLLVGTYEPSREGRELESLLRLEHVHHLPLRRLSQRQVQEMLRGLLDTDVALETVGRRLAARSDGNPLFLIEMVRELRQRSVRDDATVAMADELTETHPVPTVPSSVRDLLLARLAEVGEQDRELLETGAVQGFAFDPDLCARVLGVSRLEALTRLAALESRLGVIRTAGTGFAFDHHHLQEVLYQGIAEDRRRRLHRALAAAFEEREELADKDPGAMDGHDAVFLSRHYLAGGDPRGLRTIVEALDYLGYRYQNNLLLALAELALATLTADQVALRCDVRLRQARCLEMRGRREQQRAAAEDAVAAARSLGDSARLGWAELALARYAAAVEDFPSGREVLDRAHRRAESEGPPQLLAEILAALGSLQIDSGLLDAALSLEDRQIELARSLGNPAIEGRCR